MATTDVRPVALDLTTQTTSFGAMLVDRGAEQYMEVAGSDIHYYLDELAEARAESPNDDLVRRQDDLLPVIPPTGGYKLSFGAWGNTDLDQGCLATPDPLWSTFEKECIDTEAIDCGPTDAMDCEPINCATVPVSATSNLDLPCNSELMPTNYEAAVPMMDDLTSIDPIPREQRRLLVKRFRYATEMAYQAAWAEINYTYVRDPERNKPHFVELEAPMGETRPEPGTTEQGDAGPARPQPHLRCPVVVNGVKCRAMYRTSKERFDHMERHYLGRFLCPGVCSQRWYHSRAELVQHAMSSACSVYLLQKGVNYLVVEEPRWKMSPVPLVAPPAGDPFHKYAASAVKCPREAPCRRR